MHIIIFLLENKYDDGPFTLSYIPKERHLTKKSAKKEDKNGKRKTPSD